MTFGKQSGPSLKMRILEELKNHPHGLDRHQLAEKLGAKADSVSNRCLELSQIGALSNARPGRGKVAIWCLPSDEGKTRIALRTAESKACVWGKVGLGPIGFQTAPQATVRDGIKVVVGPTFPDKRFTVDAPERFFSAMTPGSYIKSGSAIERAYGSEQ